MSFICWTEIHWLPVDSVKNDRELKNCLLKKLLPFLYKLFGRKCLAYLLLLGYFTCWNIYIVINFSRSLANCKELFLEGCKNLKGFWTPFKIKYTVVDSQPCGIQRLYLSWSTFSIVHKSSWKEFSTHPFWCHLHTLWEMDLKKLMNLFWVLAPWKIMRNVNPCHHELWWKFFD